MCMLNCFQSCPALCNPMDCSLPGSSVHGNLQAIILEWVASPPPGDLPNPGIEPTSLMPPALAGGFFMTSATWEALICIWSSSNPLFLQAFPYHHSWAPTISLPSQSYVVIFYPSCGHHEWALLSLNAVSTVILSLPLAGESDTEIREWEAPLRHHVLMSPSVELSLETENAPIYQQSTFQNCQDSTQISSSPYCLLCLFS